MAAAARSIFERTDPDGYFSDGQHSLFKGSIGNLCALAALQDPESSRMPLFE
jgi:hypothetical protein